MDDEANMLLEPSFDLDGTVGTVIVNHQMERRVAWKLPVDAPQKLQELLMPVPRATFPDDFSLKHIQCSEKRRRPVSLVVVGHRAATSLLQRQTRLGAVQGLDLALFVDTKHDCLVGRIQVET